MGEYIKVRGEPDVRKIGTCESLFYVRFADLRTWVLEGRAEQAPGNSEPAAYLDPAAGYRYRFPFPDEDGIPGPLMDYDRGASVPAPWEIVKGLEHTQARAVITRHGGAMYHTRGNVSVDCPQKTQDNHGPAELQIVAQRLIGRQLWAVVRCPYCGAMARLPEDEARALATYSAEGADTNTLGLLGRMLAGYETENIIGWKV